MLFASHAAAGAATVTVTSTRIVSGLSAPVFATCAPGNDRYFFVVQQGSGTTASVRVVDLDAGTVLGTSFLTVSSVATSNEQGLLGLAFHPGFQSNGFFFVNFTRSSDGATVIRRYFVPVAHRGASSTSPQADGASGADILVIPQPFGNHNGGWLGFGPDGYLHIPTGDGGDANDPGNRAQDVADQLLGKVLRIDVDGADGIPGNDDDDGIPGNASTGGYTNPPDNPFVGIAGDDEIWAYGLRNPWRCSFDRATGDFWIADVGQNAWEEVNFQAANTSGLNYGWRPKEGTNDNTAVADPHPANAYDPIHEYPRATGRAITGGYVYRGSAITGLQGTYFFADYLGSTNGTRPPVFSFRFDGGVKSELTTRTAEIDPDGAGPLSVDFIASFAEDSHGELYIIDRGGELFKIIATRPWDVWRRTHFTRAQLADPDVSGPDGNPDGDALGNLGEYFTGGLPLTADPPGRVTAGVAVDGGADYLTLTILKAPGITDAIVGAEASSDVGATDPWDGSEVTVLEDSATMFRARDVIPVSGADRRFLRGVFSLEPAGSAAQSN